MTPFVWSTYSFGANTCSSEYIATVLDAGLDTRI